MGHPPGASELPHRDRPPVNAAALAREAYEHRHASQRELELRAVLDLAAAENPRIIVEIGCDMGGTLWCWRQICDEVYGITLGDNSRPTGGQTAPLDDHGATILLGDSRDPASLAWLTERLAGRGIDVLHIDGDHSYAGVAADVRAYGPLVRPGGLLLIHDVCNDRDARVDVPRFWAEWSPGRDARVIAAGPMPLGFGVVRM
jgi:cephalosporin hydroxylase